MWLEKDEFQMIVGLIVLAVVIFLFDRVIKHYIKKALVALSRDRDGVFSYFLRDERFVFWVLNLPYLTIVNFGLDWIPHLPTEVVETTKRLSNAAFIAIGLFILTHAFRIVNQIYSRLEVSKVRPIKGYLQGILIAAYLLGLICILAVLMNKSPVLLLSGLGALTAILLLVFKDSILSLVAGVQLTANELIRVGDWIEMPQFNADGHVIEIALHSVKIQNWDRTITVIPAHKFLENSFKNWRGMQESGGRRIKRSLYIDLNSIRFLKAEDIERLSQIRLLQPYLAAKQAELEEHNRRIGEVPLAEVNLRKLTNIGTFRAYVTEYLKAHPKIRQDMTLLVRQLAPGPEGLPIEIYVFANDIRWAFYEGIQADIFDHLLAVVKEFDLRCFQNPSGQDLAQIPARLINAVN